MNEFTDKKILVLGLGETGYSAVRYLTRAGAKVEVADSREAPPMLTRLKLEFPQVEVRTGTLPTIADTEARMWVVSPGLPLATPQIAEAKDAGVEMLGDVELFARAMANRNARVIGVTGSNGKSTVVSMLGAMCVRAGRETVVAGNIGLPALETLDRNPDVYVLELSSFQLETTSNLRLDAAVVLNLSEDHLDRYPDMAAYAAAKARIFLHAAKAVVNRDDPLASSLTPPGLPAVSFGSDEGMGVGGLGMVHERNEPWLAVDGRPILPLSRLRVAGLHNGLNALAAMGLAFSIGVPLPDCLAALCEFEGLDHRVQWVAEHEGVAFYDDSKGTNVGATVAAVRGFGRPLVLIAGGDGKGQDFSPLAVALAGVRGLVLIGRDGPRIAEVMGDSVPVVRAADMGSAVAEAMALARPGDAVLLSPACASLDMFRDYRQRAEVFRQAVTDLSRDAHHA